MKKIIALLVGVLLCLGLTTTVTAANGAMQTYQLVMVANEPRINGGDIGGFWESPTLRPGDYSEDRGTLVLHNATEQKQRMFLKTVELPYDDTEALRYLNHLQLTIYSAEDAVLYHGPYSEINNDPTFKLGANLLPNERAIYRIVLSCDYEYRSEDGAVPTPTIRWEFGYETTEVAAQTEEVPAGFDDPALSDFMIACGIAAVVLIAIALYSRFLKKKQQ